jgi:N utilization substance protein B
MKKRRVARERVIQFLFQHDLNPWEDIPAALEHYWELQRLGPLTDNAGPQYGQPVEFPPLTTEEAATKLFAEKLITGVIEHRESLDTLIVKHAKNWDIHRMAVVDRNVLRLAIYEMLHCEDIPPVVSINEAIDLSKKYSTPEGGKFVNGILDKIKAELMRPSRIVT